MVASSYDDALRRVLAHEGGYSNDPSDPGGPTNFGITIADYRAYVKPGASAADVKAMRLDEAKAIYRGKYWAALRCDELPAGLDYATFDYGVNSGTGRAALVLQRLLGTPVGGGMSDAIVAAAARCDAADVVTRMCDERMAFLRQLKTWPVFGAGWTRRVAEVRSVALAMARAPAPTAKTAANAAVAGGIVVGGAVAAQQIHLAGASPVVVAVVCVAALGLAVAGWAVWRRRQAAALGVTLRGE